MSKNTLDYNSRENQNKRKNNETTILAKKSKTKFIDNRKRYGKVLTYKQYKDTRHNISVDSDTQDIQKIKQLYELARNVSNCPDIKETMNQLFSSVIERIKVLIFKHDGSRIIQFCISAGTKEQRKILYNELIPYFTKLITEKYGKNILIRLLKFVPESKSYMRTVFISHELYPSWLVHKEGHVVLNIIFSEYSNSTERKEMLDATYGKTIQLLSDVKLDSKNQELLQEKYTILSKFIESCSKKGFFGEYHLAHAITLLLINFLYDNSFTHDQRLLALEPTREYLVQMALTKEGSQCFRSFTSIMSVKSRKALILECKQSLEILLNDENGHLALISLISLTDDTCTLHKHIISKIIDIPLIELGKYGKKVLLFILSNTQKESNQDSFSNKYFIPEINSQFESLLKTSHELGYSKKTLGCRMNELSENIDLSSILNSIQPNNERTAHGIANILSNNDMVLNVSIITESFHKNSNETSNIELLIDWISKFKDYLTTCPFFQTLVLGLFNLAVSDKTLLKERLISLFDASYVHNQSKTNENIFYQRLAKFLS